MVKYKLNQVLRKPYYSWEKFHEITKFKKWAPFPNLKDWPKSWTTTFFKDYPRMDKIVLPLPIGLGKMTLQSALINRFSNRNYSNEPLTLEEISNLLYFSGGLRNNTSPWVGNRTYPSPGGRYAIEIYLISINSELKKGVYHYNLRSHSLEQLLVLDTFDSDFYFNQEWVKDTSVLIFMTAIFERNTIKYGERGYRHVLEEAGHIGQNFYLTATSLNIGVCGIGGYVDEDLNKLLDVDGIKETVIYVLGLGHRS